MKNLDYRVVALILARGGSKELPRKNVALLGGKPLIAWTIEAALASRRVRRTIVSTDDDEIAAVAAECGAEVPFRRPAELSGDAATSEVALQHAVKWLDESDAWHPDVVVYLQVTDPFRRPGIVDAVIDRLLDPNLPEVDSVFAAKPSLKNFWQRGDEGWIPLGRRNYAPRQKKEPVYREDTGVALATRADVIRAGKRIGDRVDIIPHVHPGSFIDIHSELDLLIANDLIERHGLLPNE